MTPITKAIVDASIRAGFNEVPPESLFHAMYEALKSGAVLAIRQTDTGKFHVFVLRNSSGQTGGQPEKPPNVPKRPRTRPG
jgi:hypothetical protein